MYRVKRIVKPFLPALALLALAFFHTVATAGETEPIQPHMMYFYNPSCRLCTKTNEVVGAVEEKYKNDMTFQRFNISDPQSGTDNVLYMFDLMDEMKVPENDNTTLVVFIGLLETVEGEVYFTPTRVLIEGDEIIEKLNKEIVDFLGNEGKGGSLGLKPQAPFFSGSLAYASPILPDEAAFRNGEETLPQGETTVRPRIRRRADDSAEAGTGAAAGINPSSQTLAVDAGQSRADAKLRFSAITLAALADSVNPCAFATIIILVAMMSSAKRTRGEIIAVCISFTAAVFVTYFAIGLFLYKVIAMINESGGWFLVVADCIYYLAFLLCVVFGILSLRDAWMLFSGRNAEEMVLQLSKAFKKRINLAMAKGVRARWLMVGVFIAGVTVSFFEAACTGQVYLPTIISLAKISFWHSMALLTWYNFLFIVPLLIIFALVLWGVTSAQLADFFKKNVAWTKLALGLVFVIMGLVIWNEMFWPPGYRG